MKTEYILIDYENVQPAQFDALRDGLFKVLVFVGPHQTKIPIETAAALQSFGTGVEYVRIEKGGKNSLDFHIAYYLGLLSQHGAKHFHIISKDAGFDPLIQYMKVKGSFAKRHAQLSDIVLRKNSNAELSAAPIDRADRVIKHLKKSTKPRTTKTLRSAMHTIFKKEISEKALDALITELETRGVVKIAGTKVTYELPAG